MGHLDCHDLLYICGALNFVTGRLTTHMVEQGRAHAPSKQRWWGRRSLPAGARHGCDIARAYPATQCLRVVPVIDHAAWHRGALVTRALSAFPHLQCYRWPSYRPQLQLIERFWKV